MDGILGDSGHNLGNKLSDLLFEYFNSQSKPQLLPFPAQQKGIGMVRGLWPIVFPAGYQSTTHHLACNLGLPVTELTAEWQVQSV